MSGASWYAAYRAAIAAHRRHLQNGRPALAAWALAKAIAFLDRAQSA
jgi:hypothetical protein